MPDIDDLLAEMAAHPPAAPTPVDRIRGRARRRTRRRRALAGAAVVVAVLAVGAGVALTGDQAGDEVVADGGPTSPPSSASTASISAPTSSADTGPATTDVPVATEPPTMALEPATGHEDGTVVRMALDEPATGPALVAQCAAEAEALGDGSPDVLPWCTPPVEMRAEALQPFTLARTLPTPDGVVDCAEAAGRCTLGVRVGGAGSADDRYAPLVFREDLPPPVEPTVEVDGDDGTVTDGDALLITVRGVDDGDLVQVEQCRSAAEVDLSSACDDVRALRAVVQAGPETQLTFTAFHDLYIDADGDETSWDPSWQRCEPCELVVRVGEGSAVAARLPLAMEPTATPIRPAITIEPEGPHRWGDRVTVRAAGLQPRDVVPIGWCPTTSVQGGGAAACSSADGAAPLEHAVDADGTVVIEDFALPTPTDFVGTDCAVAGACGVGIDVWDGGLALAIAPLDLTG